MSAARPGGVWTLPPEIGLRLEAATSRGELAKLAMECVASLEPYNGDLRKRLQWVYNNFSKRELASVRGFNQLVSALLGEVMENKLASLQIGTKLARRSMTLSVNPNLTMIDDAALDDSANVLNLIIDADHPMSKAYRKFTTFLSWHGVRSSITFSVAALLSAVVKIAGSEVVTVEATMKDLGGNHRLEVEVTGLNTPALQSDPGLSSLKKRVDLFAIEHDAKKVIFAATV